MTFIRLRLLASKIRIDAKADIGWWHADVGGARVCFINLHNLITQRVARGLIVIHVDSRSSQSSIWDISEPTKRQIVIAVEGVSRACQLRR